MKARNWVLAASAIGLVVAMPNIVRQVPNAVASPEPEPEMQSVRVEHEFITVADTVTAAEQTDRVMPPARLHSASFSRRPPLAPSPRTFAQKARRALLGDGRYRPEPFPAARQP